MSLKTTLWLLLCVVGLGVLLLFLKPKEHLPTGGPTQYMLVESLPGGEATRVDLSLATREMLTLEARGDEWWIVDPIVDRASPATIQQFMTVLRGNPRVEIDANPSRESLEALGLEPPLARVTLYGTEGEPLRIRVGERDAVGFTHVQYEGDKALYRTGANLSNVLDRGRHEWRDTRVVAGDGAFVRGFELHRPNEAPLVLSRPGTEWLIAEPAPFPADAAVVGPLVNGLLLVTVARFIKANPTERDLADVGITPQTGTRAVFDWGRGRTIEVRFGPPLPTEPARYAIDSVRNHLFLVEGSALADLDLDAKQARDPRLVHVTTKSLRSMRLAFPDRATIALRFRESGGKFWLTEPFERPIDDARTGPLHQWLVALSAMKADDFLDRSDLGAVGDDQDPWAMMGFDQPAAVLELDLFETSNVARTVRLEFARTGDAYAVRRPERFGDTAYLVPIRSAERVLSLDPRQLLEPGIFPEDALDMKEMTVHFGGVAHAIVRDPVKGAEYFRDPTDPNRDTAKLQQYLWSLRALAAKEILGRDPRPEDELHGDDAAVIEMRIRGEDNQIKARRLVLGAKDETGSTVFAQCDAFPPRTVLVVEGWVKDELLKLFGVGN